MAPNLGIANAAMAATRGPATAAATQSPFLHDMTVRASIADPTQVAVTKPTKRGRTCTCSWVPIRASPKGHDLAARGQGVRASPASGHAASLRREALDGHAVTAPW